MRGNRMTQVGDEIKREWRKLEAPKSLVERTKEAAKQEEAKLTDRRRKRIRYVAGGSVLAAAAVLFLLLAPLDTAQGGENQQVQPISSGTWLRLGTVAEGREIYLEEEVSMERVKILPMAFLQTKQEEVIAGVKVLYARSEGGLWMAAYEDQEAYVVITAQVDGQQEMSSIMEKLFETE